MDELHELIDTAQWFTRIGLPCDGCVLATDAWDWLPTSRGQPDPMHIDTLVARDTDAELAAVKRLLVSLRRASDSVASLVDGPHDYSKAATGAAEFAVRMAAREIGNDVPGFWCNVVRIFSGGWWPCGLADSKALVVW
jgi:hypothetical protein